MRGLPQLGAIISAMLLVGVAFATIKPAFHVAIISAAAVGLFLWCLRRDLAHAFGTRMFVIAMGLPVIAWTLPNVWLLYAAMLFWVPMVARRFAYLAPVYLYSLLLLPALDMPMGLGSLKLFEFGVHDALAAGAAAAIFASAEKGKPRFMLDLPAISVMLMLGAALSRDTSFTNFLRVVINVGLDLGLPYYIVSRGVRSIDELRAAMLWMACGAITLSAILFYEALKAWPIYNQLYAKYGVDMLLLVKARGGVLRSGGPFVEPTSAAMVLALCLLALWLSRDQFRTPFRGWMLFAVGLAGMSAPQSRGAWIGLGIAVAAALIFRRHYARLFWASAVIGCAGATLFAAAAFSPYLSETLGLSGGSSETSEYRRMLFDRGLEEFWKSPIWGYSMPQITLQLSDLRQGEGIVDFVNAYIWIMLIGGTIGFVIFYGSFVQYLVKLWRFRRPIDGQPGSTTAAAFIFAGLVMPLEMLFFTSFGGRPAFYVFATFGFAVALQTIGERQRARRRAAIREAELTFQPAE